MKERPILFNGEMVRVILKGEKTQTRRVVKVQPTYENAFPPRWIEPDESFPNGCWWFAGPMCGGWNHGNPLHCHYGRSGDRLWVKEAHWRYGQWRKNGLAVNGRQKWKFHTLLHDLGVQFKSPAPTPMRGKTGWHKRPSIFMPRLASLITLEIVSVRVERLQDISEEDARAEGTNEWERPSGIRDGTAQIGAYKRLWESINGQGSWDENPWVWCISFRRIQNAR